MLNGYTEADRESIIDVYSDVYKEKHGIRPRWDYTRLRTIPFAALLSEYEALLNEDCTTQDDGGDDV